MRILVVTNMWPREEAPYYGLFVRDQVEALRAAGVEVAVFVIEGWRGRQRYASAIAPLAAQIARERYDLVHAHHGYTAWTVWRALRRAGPPSGGRLPHSWIVTLHDGDLFAPRGARVRLSHRLTRRLRLRAAARANAVISVNPAHRPPARRLICIPCGVDTARFRPLDRDEARARLATEGGFSNPPIRAGGAENPPSVGRVVFFPADPARREKRFDLARAAMDTLRMTGGDASPALIAGGAITPEAMPLYYNAADVALLLSDYEASPTALKEALACETPVVARRVGDAGLLLEGLEGAALCGSDPAQIAVATERALAAGRLRGGRERLERLGMTMAQTTTRLLALYRETGGERS